MNVTPTHPMLDSYYSQDLVFFSILVAVLASYTALTMTSRVSQSRGRAAVLWLAGEPSPWGSASGPCILSACSPSTCPSRWDTI